MCGSHSDYDTVCLQACRAQSMATMNALALSC